MSEGWRDFFGREAERDRLRRQLCVKRARIAELKALAPTCDNTPAGQATRRWNEGTVRHWERQAEKLETRLRELDRGGGKGLGQ